MKVTFHNGELNKLFVENSIEIYPENEFEHFVLRNFGDDLKTVTKVDFLGQKFFTILKNVSIIKKHEKLVNENGLTIKQLKEYVKNLPEIDEDTGKSYEVWIDGTNCETGLSNVCKEIWPLNKCDILLKIK